MEIINKYRNDAHAKTLDEKELTIWASLLDDIEKPVNEFA